MGNKKEMRRQRNFAQYLFIPLLFQLIVRGVVWSGQFDPEFFKGDMDIGMQA
jgi:hypothetical protein